MRFKTRNQAPLRHNEYKQFKMIPKVRKRKRIPVLSMLIISIPFFAILNMIFLENNINNEDIEMTQQIVKMFSDGARKMLGKEIEEEEEDVDTKVSIVILTYNQQETFPGLLTSMTTQIQLQNIELIVVDNGCLPETKAIVDNVSNQTTEGEEETNMMAIKYLPLCNNPGYAIGNNEGVKIANEESQYILLLNDDIVIEDETFVRRMVDLAIAKKNAAAVGCMLLTADGEEIIEAGSIVWNDGSAAGFGRGSKDFEQTQFSYTRPVDYVSGACLLVDKDVFTSYGGFDHVNFPNYFEDTDLQMHIQHDLKKQVWLQPFAVAYHDEHGSFGSDDSKKMMKQGHKIFKTKWASELAEHHVPPPFPLIEYEQQLAFLRASDLRARDPKKANILYIDERVPNKSQGAGFGRAFDNLSMLAELGHRITVTKVDENASESWCDMKCRNKLLSLGIEVVYSDWYDFAESRIGFYDIVLVSRPSTLKKIHGLLRTLYKMYPFSLIYDCEALWYQRDEGMLYLVHDQGIEFPGANESKLDFQQPSLDLVMKAERDLEISFLSMADTIVPVAEGETETIKRLLPQPTTQNVHTIGHVMEMNRVTRNSFSERKGILFLASFGGQMYYNGDAIWYFLKEIYPLINEYIPLTIAGTDIPTFLHDMVRKAPILSDYVSFIGSPKDIQPLYEDARIVIAPHLYGAGIQYKVSEALSVGVPVIMSSLTANGFGFQPEDEIGCTGGDIESFKKCILDVYYDEEKWTKFRDNGLDFIRQTHSYEKAMEVWSTIISNALKEIDITRDSNIEITEQCPEGERKYLHLNRDVAEAIKRGNYETGFQHWEINGKSKGRSYSCMTDAQKQSGLLTTNTHIVEENPDDEEFYKHILAVSF
mmetsp:Transcript_4202/g.4836  ORF Transcript_4202/g.4836 Transcript_4202/m.4836 type:complete len:876 (+) Transcript_4202:264-2891(+)